MRKVVITGMGAICGYGINGKEIWSNLLQGIVSRTKITAAVYGFDPAEKPKSYSAGKSLIDTVCGVDQIDADLAKNLGHNPKARDRHQLFAEIAAAEAMYSANVGEYYRRERRGCVTGTGGGGFKEIADAHANLHEGKALPPRSNLKQLPNIFAGYLSQLYGLEGPNHVHCTACTASLHAIQHAAMLIQADVVDMVLTGGADASISPFGIASFASQRAISNESRPLQIGRPGFLMGEGAAMLVLEERENAIARGARILAEIVGYGASADAQPVGALITDPLPKGGARAVQQALEMAELSAKDIQCVKLHGTGTPKGDSAEIDGIKLWAGEHIKDLLVTAPKSFVGHLLGAAGALETALSVNMLIEQSVLHTQGLSDENLDPQCVGPRHVMHSPRAEKLEHLLVQSFGFGGTNGALILRRA